MSEFSEKQIRFLEAAKSSVLQQQEAVFQAAEQDNLVKKMEKNLEQESSALEESISLMIKKRRGEIESNYNRQLTGVQNTIKKVRAKREKAKSRGMKSRMNDETADLRQENRMLRNELHTLFRKEKVPGFCNTWVFYALYYPRQWKEIAFFLLFLILVFIGIPFGIYWMIPKQGIPYLVGVYALDIVIFGGIYILINNCTKVHHNSVLKEGKKLRRHMAGNRKKIRHIENGIRKDTNEEMYGLDRYDDKLAQLENDHRDILNEQKAALDIFDGETREKIRQEILENNRERMHHLEEDLKEAEEELDRRKQEEQFWGRKVNERFGNDLGQEFLNPDKLDQLIEAFSQGAANMMEAQDWVRNNQDKNHKS